VQVARHALARLLLEVGQAFLLSQQIPAANGGVQQRLDLEFNGLQDGNAFGIEEARTRVCEEQRPAALGRSQRQRQRRGAASQALQAIDVIGRG